MNFAIYSRKSVYTGKGESIENQIEMCREYIRLCCPADTAVTVYEDEGFSGRDMNRPRFSKMLLDMRSGKIDCIVCYKLDRLSRSISDFAPFVEELGRLGVGLICIREKFDTTTPMGKAMIYIASVFAQLERETIAERVRDNMLMLARDGRWLGGTPPTGFRPQKLQAVMLDGRKKSSCILIPDQKETETVKEIYHLFLHSGSVSAVGNALSSAGILSRRGRPFTLSGIRDILKNPVYCTVDKASFDYFSLLGSDVCFSPEDFVRAPGILPYNRRNYSKKGFPRNPEKDWIIAVGRHHGIISGHNWVKVQKMLRSGSPRGCFRAPLGGLLYCGLCHSRLYPKRRCNSDKYDYICSKKLSLGASACKCPNIPGEPATEAVCRALLNLSEIQGIVQGLTPKKLSEEALTQLFGILISHVIWDGESLLIEL